MHIGPPSELRGGLRVRGHPLAKQWSGVGGQHTPHTSPVGGGLIHKQNMLGFGFQGHFPVFPGAGKVEDWMGVPHKCHPRRHVSTAGTTVSSPDSIPPMPMDARDVPGILVGAGIVTDGCSAASVLEGPWVLWGSTASITNRTGRAVQWDLFDEDAMDKA